MRWMVIYQWCPVAADSVRTCSPGSLTGIVGVPTDNERCLRSMLAPVLALFLLEIPAFWSPFSGFTRHPITVVGTVLLCIYYVNYHCILCMECRLKSVTFDARSTVTSLGNTRPERGLRFISIIIMKISAHNPFTFHISVRFEAKTSEMQANKLSVAWIYRNYLRLRMLQAPNNGNLTSFRTDLGGNHYLCVMDQPASTEF